MGIELGQQAQQRTVDGVPARAVTDDGAAGIEIREVFTDREGAPTFAMRRFDVAPGGHTPFHVHPWEHEVYILEGEGELRTEAGVRPFRQGDALLVPPNLRHQFAGMATGAMRFLCMIPVQKAC